MWAFLKLQAREARATQQAFTDLGAVSLGNVQVLALNLSQRFRRFHGLLHLSGLGGFCSSGGGIHNPTDLKVLVTQLHHHGVWVV